MSEKTKVPSPGGRGGGEKHKNLVQQVIDFIMSRGLGFKRESEVKLENGKKRFADVAALDENNNVVEYHQVGLQNKNETPVSRERKAKDDIEKASGLKVIFHPYNLIILLIAILTFVYFYK